MLYCYAVVIILVINLPQAPDTTLRLAVYTNNKCVAFNKNAGLLTSLSLEKVRRVFDNSWASNLQWPGNHHWTVHFSRCVVNPHRFQIIQTGVQLCS